MDDFLRELKDATGYDIDVFDIPAGARITVRTQWYPLLNEAFAGSEITYAKYGDLPFLTGFPDPRYDETRLTEDGISLILKFKNYFGMSCVKVTKYELVLVSPGMNRRNVSFMLGKMFRVAPAITA